MADVIEREVESLARTIVMEGGMDPDMLVQIGEPRVLGTPHGRAVAVTPGAEEPLWRAFIGMARAALALAREQLTLPPSQSDMLKASADEVQPINLNAPAAPAADAAPVTDQAA